MENWILRRARNTRAIALAADISMDPHVVRW
jgi:hypothetical protein